MILIRPFKPQYLCVLFTTFRHLLKHTFIGFGNFDCCRLVAISSPMAAGVFIGRCFYWQRLSGMINCNSYHCNNHQILHHTQ